MTSVVVVGLVSAQDGPTVTADDSAATEPIAPKQQGPGEPEIDYTMYDLFEQPWGEWWPWRLAVYKTDVILSNEPHEYTMVYNPDMRNRQGLIMAPYRWNTTAVNMSTLDVDDPEFMPALGTENLTGAAAHLDVYFEYLSWDWWNNYWLPTWSTNYFWNSGMDGVMTSQTSDGYYLGTVYTATMNRASAETWLNLPQGESDPAGWWTANRDTYKQDWIDWIQNEGNVRLDIWPGYEWPYIDIGTCMDLEIQGSDIVLKIGHLNWGYEVMTTRWMTEIAACSHEPYWEDYTLSVDYKSDHANLTADGVAQYNLHAVKQNASSIEDAGAAWVWEPQNIDYVAMEGSDFTPWDVLTYQSWNAGDIYFGTEVAYDFTPTYFNLTSDMTLSFQLPLGDNVIGYRGVGLPNQVPYPITLLKGGNDSMYENITIRGPMWLGHNKTGDGPGAPDLSTMYDNSTKTLVMVGPMDFDNFHHATGELYHSAPWIEFNVANGTGPVDEPPTADAGPDQEVAVGEIVFFDGSASSDDIEIANYTWTIGALSQEMYGVSPVWMFDTAGTYAVGLVVTDTIGQSSAPDVMIVNVTDAGLPIADAGPDQIVDMGTTVTLDGSGSSDDVGIVNWTWMFDDDGLQMLYGMYADYVFQNAGEFYVLLIVLDGDMNWAMDDVNITVLDTELPVADAGADQWVNMSDVVTLDGSGSSDNVGVVNWTWSFDDGGLQTLWGETVTHAFADIGPYEVTLTVRDDAGLEDTDSMTVTVRDSEPPTADAGGDATVMGGEVVELDGSMSSDNVGIVNWTWAFDDGGTPVVLYGPVVNYTFWTEGVFDITLTVTDAEGNIGIDVVQITVSGFIPEFPALVLPIIGLMAAVLVLRRKRS
ncbi:MAG TPA: PKD domain-containing protein [Thermoplasmata archaeon]|jgi:PKD repeat protein